MNYYHCPMCDFFWSSDGSDAYYGTYSEDAEEKKCPKCKNPLFKDVLNKIYDVESALGTAQNEINQLIKITKKHDFFLDDEIVSLKSSMNDLKSLVGGVNTRFGMLFTDVKKKLQ